MGKKFKWTLVDTLIVLLVIIAGVALVNVFGVDKATGEAKTIEAVVLLAQEDNEVKEAMTVGDEITISLTEKDSGILKDVKAEPAAAMGFNAIDGTYSIEPIDSKVDIYATIELDVAESDTAITCGSSVIKVGERLPVRSKGYALEGFVVEIK